MASPDLIFKAVNETANNQDLSRYDQNVCLDIHRKLDGKLKEQDLSIAEKSVFVNIKNYFFLVIKKFELKVVLFFFLLNLG